MTAIIAIIFIVGYLAIAFEHSLKINKAASALLTGVICWSIFAPGGKSGVAVRNTEQVGAIGKRNPAQSIAVAPMSVE